LCAVQCMRQGSMVCPAAGLRCPYRPSREQEQMTPLQSILLTTLPAAAGLWARSSRSSSLVSWAGRFALRLHQSGWLDAELPHARVHRQPLHLTCATPSARHSSLLLPCPLPSLPAPPCRVPHPPAAVQRVSASSSSVWAWGRGVHSSALQQVVGSCELEAIQPAMANSGVWVCTWDPDLWQLSSRQLATTPCCITACWAAAVTDGRAHV